jgi:hypothetical protein
MRASAKWAVVITIAQSVLHREMKYKHLLKQNRATDRIAIYGAAHDELANSKIDQLAFVGVFKQAAQFVCVGDARAGDDLRIHLGLGD